MTSPVTSPALDTLMNLDEVPKLNVKEEKEFLDRSFDELDRKEHQLKNANKVMLKDAGQITGFKPSL